MLNAHERKNCDVQLDKDEFFNDKRLELKLLGLCRHHLRAINAMYWCIHNIDIQTFEPQNVQCHDGRGRPELYSPIHRQR